VLLPGAQRELRRDMDRLMACGVLRVMVGGGWCGLGWLRTGLLEIWRCPLIDTIT
jgi:hypothetical protein